MSNLIRHMIDRLRDESGVAVPIALAILTATLALATATALVALQNNGFTNKDNGNKAAIEAANAGLRTAVYRLNTYQPQNNYCPTEPTNVAVGSAGAPSATMCPPDGPETLGNGATFTYWISRAMQTGDTCAGPSLTSTQAQVSQRCVTSVGTANGISVRVQQRVAAYSSAPAFPAAIFGTKSVTVSNNEDVTTDTASSPALLATNGILTVGGAHGGGNTLIDGYSLPPGATLSEGQNVTNLGPTTPIGTQYAVPTPIYPFSTHQNTASPYDTPTTAQAGTCSQSEAQAMGWSGTWSQTNCNYEISQGLTYRACLSNNLPVKDCDVSSGNVTLDSNRNLTLGNNSSLVLQGGYYDFCSLTMSNNSTITVAGGQATVFIDSPQDPNSGCPTGTGTFSMSQNSSFNPGGSALNAQILVYGDQQNTPPTNTVTMTNNSSSSFALLAPFSIVNLSPSNNTVFKGAIAGYTVNIGNAGTFTYEADTKSFQSSAVPVYYPSYWEQCPSTYTSTAPTTGC